MARLGHTERIENRGNIQRTDTGWRVTMPMGIKNRRFETFEFSFPGTTVELFESYAFKFSKSNAKLKKTAKKFETKTGTKIEIWAYNLPALLACPGAGECPLFCYALQGQFGYRNVMESRAYNYALLHELNARGGVNAVAHALILGLRAIVAKTPKNRDEVWLRIHDSGDMFSLWYIKAWAVALSQVPEVKAYAYTKSIGLLSKVQLPSNLRIVQSVGGTMDDQMSMGRPHSRVFATHEEREALGYVDGNESDIPAMMSVTRVGLVYHGTENLETIAA